MNFVEHIKSNPTIDDVLHTLMKEAKAASTDEVVQQLLSKLPYDGSEEWFVKMYSIIDSLVQYQLDENGKEQLRTPSNTLRNGIGDCDDFSILWSALLTAVSVAHGVKIVDYQVDGDNDKGYDHVYIVVPVGDGYITLDSVLRKYNKEVPHKQSRLYIYN